MVFFIKIIIIPMLIVFALFSINLRFENPNLTETQLFIKTIDEIKIIIGG